jgi:hypothetical protein
MESQDRVTPSALLAPAGVDNKICCAAGAAASLQLVANPARLIDDQHRRAVVAQRQAAQPAGLISRTSSAAED